MAVQLMTVSAYARHRGCDEKAVRKAIADKRITPITDAQGKRRIDPAVADIQWAQNTRARADSVRPAGAAMGGDAVVSGAATAAATGPPTAAPGAADGQPGYADYRARTEKANAERAERENMRDAGRLVEADHVRRGIFDSYRALRDAVMAVGPRAAPKCIGMGDAREIERVISDELRRALEDFEERMLALLPKEDA